MSGGVAVIDQDSIESVTDLWHCFVLYLLHVPQGSTWSQIVLDGATAPMGPFLVNIPIFIVGSNGVAEQKLQRFLLFFG